MIAQELDDLIIAVRDHRAATFVARNRLVDGFSATPTATRHARRHRADSPISILPDRDED